MKVAVFINLTVLDLMGLEPVKISKIQSWRAISQTKKKLPWYEYVVLQGFFYLKIVYYKVHGPPLNFLFFSFEAKNTTTEETYRTIDGLDTRAQNKIQKLVRKTVDTFNCRHLETNQEMYTFQEFSVSLKSRASISVYIWRGTKPWSA